jgi:ribonuclease HI
LNHQVHIYTDGAAKGNPGNGGYGVIVELVGTTYKKEFYEGFRHTTNNRMELLGVIVGLEKLKIPNMNVLVISDSKYVVDAVVKKWVFGWEKKRFRWQKKPRFMETISDNLQKTPSGFQMDKRPQQPSSKRTL